jgi:hypothetical protein
MEENVVDLAKLEAEAETAARQYQEALSKQLLALVPDNSNPAVKDVIERFVVTANEAANFARQAQQAALRQALEFAGFVQSLTGQKPPGE